MTKKQLKEKNAKQRVFFEMNLGTRNMKSAKDYDRKKLKKNLKKMLDSNNY